MDGHLWEGLVVAKEVPVTTDIAHLMVGPKTHHCHNIFKPLLSSKLRLSKRSRVICVAIVIVQALRDSGQVLLLESLAPPEHEFDLWRIGGF